MMQAKPLFLVLVVGVLSGCGSAQFQAGEKWKPEETRFFDDGVDIVEDLSALSGKWERDQDDSMEARSVLADLVAEVEVVAVRTVTEFDGEKGKAITVKMVHKFYGTSPEDPFTVSSSKESAGYMLIKRYETRLTGRFIVFVRWFEQEDAAGKTSIGHHFHLSPSSDKVRAEVAEWVKARIQEEGAKKEEEGKGKGKEGEGQASEGQPEGEDAVPQETPASALEGSAAPPAEPGTAPTEAAPTEASAPPDEGE